MRFFFSVFVSFVKRFKTCICVYKERVTHTCVQRAIFKRMLKHTGAASRTLFLIKSYTIDFHWCPLRRPFLSFNRTIPWNNSTRSCLLFLVFVICKIGSPTRMYKPARNGTFLRWRRAMISDIQAWHVVQDADMFGHSPFESHSIDRGMYRRWQIDGFSHDCCDWVVQSNDC